MIVTEDTQLRNLAVELKRQLDSKEDMVIDSRRFSLDEEPVAGLPGAKSGSLLAAVDKPGGVVDYNVTRYAHQQIGEFTNVPWKLYERLLGKHPDLLADLVNGLLHREPKKRTVRVLDGNVRAFLSNSYRPRYNWDLLENAILPELDAYSGRVWFKECSLTDRRMYVKIVFPEITKPITPKVGDLIRGGLIFTNSEVGAGSLGIYPYSDKLLCTNGMVHTEFGQRTIHVGKQVKEESWDLFSERTLALDDEAFFAKCRDTVRNVLNTEVFEQIVQQMRDLADLRIAGDPVAHVQDITKRHDFTDAESGSMLNALVEGGDLSAWGYVNAITQTARDLDDADRRTELETLAGKLTSDSAWAEALVAA